jgi:hypothetical protein
VLIAARLKVSERADRRPSHLPVVEPSIGSVNVGVLRGVGDGNVRLGDMAKGGGLSL